MRRTIVSLTIVAAMLAATVPASAQYYGGGGYDGPPSPYGYGRRPPPPDEDDDFDRPRRRYGPGPGYGDGRFSRTCITSRGACPTGRPLPHGAPCGCEIPGFGYKRGATN